MGVLAGMGFFDRHDETVFTDGEADAGCGNAAAQTFSEAVVAATTEDRILRTEGTFVDNLESCAGVVVETADHARVDGVANAAIFEIFAHAGEVGLGVFVEIVVNGRQCVDIRLVFGGLRVKDAQGVGFKAALRVWAELIDYRSQLLADGFDEGRTRLRRADAVEHELVAGDTAGVEEVANHLDHFCVDGRGFATDDFGTDLRELAVAAFLGTLAAEHGADVEELLETGDLIEAMFDVGADDAGRVLRAEGEAGIVAVFEGVHLFGDDVGFFADASREESGFFKDGGADFLIVVGVKKFAGDAFDVVPDRDGRREDVAGAFNGFDHAGSSR